MAELDFSDLGAPDPAPLSFRTESDLRRAAAFTPAEQASNRARETSDATRAELDAAIATAPHPAARQALEQTRAQDFGGGLERRPRPRSADLDFSDLGSADEAPAAAAPAGRKRGDWGSVSLSSAPAEADPGQLDYILTDLKIGWNGLRKSVEGARMSEYGGLLSAFERRYTPQQIEADPKLKAEHDLRRTKFAEAQAKAKEIDEETQALQQTGRPSYRRLQEANDSTWTLDNLSRLGKALVENPGSAVSIVTQSGPASVAMLASAVVARVAGFSGGVAAGAGGYASQVAEFGSDYAELREKGYSHDDAYRDATIKSGIVGLLDAVSMKSAGNALDDVLGKGGFFGKVKTTAKELGKQSALGMAGEGLGSLASGRTPDPLDVLAEGVGELAMGPVEAVTTFSGRPRRDRRPDAGAPVPADDALGRPADAAPPSQGMQRGDINSGDQTARQRLAQLSPDDPAVSMRRMEEIDAELSAGGEGVDLTGLQAERDRLAEGLLSGVQRGRTTTFTTESGARIDAEFGAVDADQLQASQRPDMSPNPDYPGELQPRDRSRAASELQVAKIAGNLAPERLAESGDAGTGAPIIGGDGLVESGNARTIALQRAYQGRAVGTRQVNNGPVETLRGITPAGEAYRQWLIANAAQFGLDPDAVAGMRAPVLVRIRRTPVNRVEFAQQANQATVAQMAPSELARADAQRMGSLDGLHINDDGEFMLPANDGIIRGFFRSLPITEQAALVDQNGRVSPAGYARFRNALLAKAYGNNPVVERLTESMSPLLRNLTNALIRMAPMVAKAKEEMQAGAIADRDITDDIVRAVDELVKLRMEGRSLGQMLAQSAMFSDLTPETIALMEFLDENVRSPARIGEFIQVYLEELQRYGSEQQNDMFGGVEVPGRADLIQTARGKVTPNAEGQQPEAAADQATEGGRDVPGGTEAPGEPAGPAAPAARPEDAAAVSGTPGAGDQRADQPDRGAAGAAGTEQGAGGVAAPEQPSTEGEKPEAKPKPKREPKPKPSPKAEAAPKQLTPEEQAQADLDAALGDLGDLLGKGTRLNVTPDQEAKLVPILTRLFDAAFRLGYHKFKRAAKFALDTVRAKLGAEVADQITIEHLQGAYIGMSGKYRDQGADAARNVVAVETLAEINASDINDDERVNGDGRKDQARNEPASAVQAVAQYEGQVSQSAESVLPQLRGAGGDGVRGVGAQLPGVSSGGGRSPESAAYTGSGEQRRPLRADERQVGDEARAGEQSAQEPESDAQRKDSNAGRVGAGDRASTVGAALPDIQGGDVGGRGIDVSAQGGSEAFSSAIARSGLKVTKTTTKNGSDVWEVSGNTREHSDVLKRLGGRWYGPKKVWSFYKGDPTADIAKALGGTKPAIAETQPANAGPEAPPRDTAPANSETVSPESPADSMPPHQHLAEWVKGNLHFGRSFTSADLFKHADLVYGGTQAEGKYTPKDAYDALELGVNQFMLRWARADPTTTSVAGAKVQMEALATIMGRIPSQTKRTQEQDEFQQFSTPPTYAFLANWVANIRRGETYLEPSAGIGGLAVFGKNAGATVIVNEFSPRRAEILRAMGFDRTFTENAEQLHNALPDDVKPSVIVMNPPFSATAGRIPGQRDFMNGARHIDQALQRLEPGGRLVVIMGKGRFEDSSAWTEWIARVKRAYTLRADVVVDGKEYAKYGTTFDVRFMVFDKTGTTQNSWSTVKGEVSSPVEALTLLEGVRNDRPQIAGASPNAQPGASQSARPEDARGDGRGAGGAQPAPSATAGVGDRQPGAGAQPGARPAGATGTAQPGSAPGTAGAGVSVPDGGRRDGRAGDGAVRGNEQPEGSSAPAGESGARPDSDVRVSATEEEAAKADITESVFESYAPQRLSIPGAQPHPGKLVQSAAMATVQPPAPTYQPNLPKAVIEKGELSLAQLESVVYAGQAHTQLLPSGERMGYFIGDGTGVGKGREISGIILDNMRQGRARAVWISEKQGLYKDARRDFAGVGGNPDQVFKHSATKYGEKVKATGGILFTTYATMRQDKQKAAKKKGKAVEAGKSRVEQIAEWLGPDFDGVIVFDEAHNMGNAIAMKGNRGISEASEQALAGVELQRRLPQARVVYVSATGATEVSNLSYASRLGLWGDGTPFQTVQQFIGQIEDGGLSGMELVARDMKQMGVYLARSLSFDGVTYSRLEHPLTNLQRDIYNELARSWQIVLQNVNEALELTGAYSSEKGQPKNGQARAAAMSAFWGAHQRFFNQIITSMQMPVVLEQLHRDIEAGDAAVLQLVNTNEAIQNRQLATMAEDEALEDLDLTPRENLIQYIKNSFPIVQYEEYEDENGNRKTRPAKDSAGNVLISKEAVAKRDALLETLQAIRVPDGPLEIILNEFGIDTVAEVTGRGKRVLRVKDKDGGEKVIVETRPGNAAQSDAEAFMADKKRILVFSDAGGTGFSFHADLTKTNQRKRKHYLIQPGWRADKAVQGFGRTHRTNQKSEPHYYLVTTDLLAQKRFISSIARRLDQLGALTKGQRDTANQGLFSAKDNLESKYAEDAVMDFFVSMHRGQAEGFDFQVTTKMLGFDNLLDQKTGQLIVSKIPHVPQFLNRLLSLETHEQERVFNEFARRMEIKIDKAIADGTLDAGMQTVRAQEVRVKNEQVVNTDERSGAETRYVEFELTQPNRFYDFDTFAAKAGVRFVQNIASGKVWAVMSGGRTTKKDGSVVDRYYIHGTGSGRYVETSEIAPDKFKQVDADQARTLWDAENTVRPKTYTEPLHMVVGSLLPVWDRMPGFIRVARTQTVDGRRYLGRVISGSDLNETLKRLGASSPAARMAPADVMRAIMDEGRTAELANGWKLMRRRVSNENRLEIDLKNRFPSDAVLGEIKRLGGFVERIQFQERAFLPTNDLAPLERLMKARPVVDMTEGRGGQPALSRRAPARESIGMDGGRVSVRDVRAMVGELGSKLARKPRGGILVVDFADELPPRLRDFLLSQGAMDKTEGLYDPDNDAIYLIARNLASMPHAQYVLFHELYGHFGLRGLFGNRLNGVLELIAAGNPNIREAAAKKRADHGYDTHLSIEEAMADLAGEGRPFGGFKRFMAALQGALRRMGAWGQGLASWLESLTDAEALRVIAQSRAYVERGGRAGGAVRAQAVPTFYQGGDGPTLSQASTLPARTSLTDRALAATSRAVGLPKLTGGSLRLIGRVAEGTARRLLPAGTVENIKAGVVDKYGLTQPVLDRRAELYGAQATQLKGVERLIEQLGTLTRSELAVLYRAATTADGDEVNAMISDLPEESKAVLANMKTLVHQLGTELVRLGQMQAETMQRNEWAYLHRMYRRFELDETPAEAGARARRIAVLGDAYKLRGMMGWADMKRIQAAAPDFWKRKLQAGKADITLKGEKFIRFERRKNRGEGVAVLDGMEETGQLGRLLEVQYWPAAEPVPARYADWHEAGVWEARFFGDRAHPGQVGMWRDFTAEERERMGEIDDVRYAFAKTMHTSIHNVEVGRYLEWLANTQAVQSADKLPAGAVAIERDESSLTGLRRVFRPDEWVRVPETRTGKHGPAKYGALAGMYVPGPIWNDIRQTINTRWGPEWWRTALRAWKVSKTAISPVVHLNNVMANIVMADWHDIRPRHVYDALRAMAAFELDRSPDGLKKSLRKLVAAGFKPDVAQSLIDAFGAEGGTQGMYMLSELQREQLAPILEQLRADLAQNSTGAAIGMGAAIQAVVAGRFRDAWTAMANSKAAAAGKWPVRKLMEAYQAEDTIFRLAAFIQARERGLSDREAGRFARESFLDYDITAPWIRAMRDSAFPFISFTYRAVPMLADIAANKPHKLLKLALLMGGVNALGYLFSGGDEDAERKLLPEEKAGRLLGVLGPKLIRMPWNDEHGSPVFLDVRRFMPLGDFFDVNQTQSAIPVLPAMMPGGPGAILVEVIANKSLFTGKDITNRKTDELNEQFSKTAEHVYKAFAPNLPILPGTYSFDAIANAATGRTDAFGREQSTRQAVMSAFGWKEGSYPADVAIRNLQGRHAAQMREIGEEISTLRKEFERNGITRERFETLVAEQIGKRQKLERELAEKVAP